MKPARLQPLTKFDELSFFCNFTFLNEHHQERSSDEMMETPLLVRSANSNNDGGADDDETYTLVGKFASDQQHVSRFALTGQYDLDFMVVCRLANNHLVSLCMSPQLILGEQLKELLPLGERSAATVGWTLEGTVEMAFSPDCDESYALRLYIERRFGHFFVRRVELDLPREACNQWFARMSRLLRQVKAGITHNGVVPSIFPQ
jgi:hypothetical protein